MIVRTYHAKLKERFPLLYGNKNITRITDMNGISNNQKTNTVHNSNIDADTCLLQATIFCYELFGSTKVASSLLSYIIRNGIFHRERMNAKTDEAGNLTLHIACLSETPTYDQILRLGDRDGITNYGLNSEDCTLMQYLISNANTHPSTVSPYLSKNHEGDIPLHCAIKSGKYCSEIQLLIDEFPSSVQCCTWNEELPLHLAIKCGIATQHIIALWNYYPEAATIMDNNRLYPFMLAAICGRGSGGSSVNQQSLKKGKVKKKKSEQDNQNMQQQQKEDDDMDDTSLSFFLLRECPIFPTRLST